MARPKKYATEAERQAAYRDRYAVIPVRLTKETAATLDKIAEYLDVPRTEVANSLINFALLNHNTLALGLFGKRLPHASDKRLTKERKENPLVEDFVRELLMYAVTKGL